eukprot:CAMPEP_0170144840 /NCGR_PEP_ID=MMETSP0033_2-20121228/16201_1 /TAXON_ID=195969 /ORGANISM="Dolichomastix tenuilepis, Strain CCMP3274" /LENGTH=228 /DNA_ID=CAMNT_0010381363 /DNA_START=16 /DNA_END=699 /DNA_ORIENTATION=-
MAKRKAAEATTTAPKKQRTSEWIGASFESAAQQAERLSLWFEGGASGGAPVAEERVAVVPSASAAGEDTLEDRLRALEPEWERLFCLERERRGSAIGAPALVIVCSSAVRSLEVIRLLPTFRSRHQIIKAFAKHLKVAEQEALLRDTECGIVVGTPNRLLKLAEGGALKPARLKYLAIDLEKDMKAMTVFDVRDCAADLRALWRDHFAKAKGVRVCLLETASAAADDD